MPGMRHAFLILLGLLALLAVACAPASSTPIPSVPPGTGLPPVASPSTATLEPSPTQEPSGEPSTAPVPSAEPTPSGSGLSPEAQALLGTDGRWTVLLLGTDARPPLVGNRTDTMIVATVDPSSGRVVAVSLPRDTAQVPIAADMTFQPKVNLLFQGFLDETGTEEAAAQRMVEALSFTFDVEIDDFAFIGFSGLMRAINVIDGVDVTLDAPIDDPRFENPDGTRGIHLKAGVNHLDGQTALSFARTRHQDNDYERSRRQQRLVAAAVEKVRTMGLDSVPQLLRVVEDRMVTDISLSDAAAVLEILQQADLEGRKEVVLGPTKWASSPVLYTNVLRIDVVRDFFDSAFAPVQ